MNRFKLKETVSIQIDKEDILLINSFTEEIFKINSKTKELFDFLIIPRTFIEIKESFPTEELDEILDYFKNTSIIEVL